MNKCFWCILFILRFGSKAHTSSLIKKLINFSKRIVNTHVALGFVLPINELNDYSNKPVKQKSVQKQPQKVFFKKRCFLKFGKIHRKTPVPEFKIDSQTFLWILRNFWEHIFYRTPLDNCFCLFKDCKRVKSFGNWWKKIIDMLPKT